MYYFIKIDKENRKEMEKRIAFYNGWYDDNYTKEAWNSDVIAFSNARYGCKNQAFPITVEEAKEKGYTEITSKLYHKEYKNHLDKTFKIVLDIYKLETIYPIKVILNSGLYEFNIRIGTLSGHYICGFNSRLNGSHLYESFLEEFDSVDNMKSIIEEYFENIERIEEERIEKNKKYELEKLKELREKYPNV